MQLSHGQIGREGTPAPNRLRNDAKGRFVPRTTALPVGDSVLTVCHSIFQPPTHAGTGFDGSSLVFSQTSHRVDSSTPISSRPPVTRQQVRAPEGSDCTRQPRKRSVSPLESLQQGPARFMRRWRVAGVVGVAGVGVKVSGGQREWRECGLCRN